MTNTENTKALSAPAVEGEGYFLLTFCADHGTRECDWDSARHYVELVQSWWGVKHDDPDSSAWWCCDHMVLDPWGVFDH